MVRVPSLEDVKRAYREGGARASSSYRESVSKTSGVISAAIAAEGLWGQKMNEAISSQARAKGLARVSDADWQKAAMEKGAARIGPGMAAAVDKQASRFAPYLSELASIDLPARTADPATNVDNRVKTIAIRMAQKKKELRGT